MGYGESAAEEWPVRATLETVVGWGAAMPGGVPCTEQRPSVVRVILKLLTERSVRAEWSRYGLGSKLASNVMRGAQQKT